MSDEIRRPEPPRRSNVDRSDTGKYDWEHDGDGERNDKPDPSPGPDRTRGNAAWMRLRAVA